MFLPSQACVRAVHGSVEYIKKSAQANQNVIAFLKAKLAEVDDGPADAADAQPGGGVHVSTSVLVY